MKHEEKLGSVKRFGARYGRKLKLKFSKIEVEQRRHHKCPYCGKMAVKRLAVGIWQCKKCSSKFTGQAYSITRKILTIEAKSGEEEELPKEEMEEAQQASEEA
ncbi:MAG: 50S ribosomal protein L37ae [Nanoarchaeota archaeon]